jgi:D-inositol-3-phosphate glycosyltransferase
MSRIALVVPNLSGGGGVPSAARFLARAIERSGDLECQFISLATSAFDGASLRLTSPRSWLGKPSVDRYTWEGREVRHVGAWFVELEFQRYRPRRVLSRVLEGFDLVQIVAGSPAYALAARDFAGPVALQVATLAAVERGERFRCERNAIGAWRRAMTAVTKRLDRAGAAVPDRIFVLNEWMRRTVSTWTGPERVVLAPPGIDAELFRPGASGCDATAGNAYILSVGRFADVRKSVRLLFEAYARLRARLPACPRLVLAGKSAPSPSDWSRARELGLDAALSWQGEVSRERLGLVLLEAMASGVPVVATRTEGARQAVEDGKSGLLVPVGDAPGLAAAIERLLADPDLRAAMGRRAREVVEMRYSEEVAARLFVRAYRDLLDSGRGRGGGSTGTGRTGGDARAAAAGGSEPSPTAGGRGAEFSRPRRARFGWVHKPHRKG